MSIPLIDKKVQLQKFPGKGGWTYAPFDGESKGLSFLKVKGLIDDYELETHLMPMGNGKLFIPVKAEIRKKIKKEVDDWVHLVLYRFQQTEEVNHDSFLLCLNDDPDALKNFNAFSKEEQKLYSEWIFSTDNEEVQIQRIAKAVSNIALGQKLNKHSLKNKS